jgi:hypothetical protein
MATTIWEIPLDSVKNFYEDDPFITYLLNESGFDAFDIDKSFPGSYVNGDTLYLLDTDYEPIEILDTVIDDPETLLDEYTIEDLDEFGLISSATVEIIRRNLTDYELKPFDFDDVATDLILSDDYTFTELLKSADKLGYLNDLL